MISQDSSLPTLTYSVLVVDDDPEMREAVVTFLSESGHQCSQAADGVEALEKAQVNKFDAVVTDIAMPRMDGITLVKELLMRIPNLPILVMTGLDNESLTFKAVSAGAKEFIKKPFRLGEFALRFQKMMRDHEILIHIEEKQREIAFHFQRKTQKEIDELKKEIETLRNRLNQAF